MLNIVLIIMMNLRRHDIEMATEDHVIHELQGVSGEYRYREATRYYRENYSNDIDVMEGEEWRYILGYGDKYQVSNLGRIRRMHRKIHPAKGLIVELNKIRLVKPCATKNGYSSVTLYT